MLLVLFGHRRLFFWEACAPELAFVEERFALPDLFHDDQRLTHHLVEEGGFRVLDPVDVRSQRIGARADSHEVAAFKDLREPAHRHRQLGGMLVRKDVRHRGKFDRVCLQCRRSNNEFGIGNVFPDLRGVLGDHHRGEADLVALHRAIDSPLERLTGCAARTHVRVENEAGFHRHFNSPKTFDLSHVA